MMGKRMEREHQVAEFQRGLPQGSSWDDRIGSRMKLIEEEFHELMAELAYIEPESSLESKVNLLKELCDLQYVLSGTVAEFGWENIFQPAFNRVHANNIEKLNHCTFKDGKLHKPKDWPDVKLDDLVGGTEFGRE